MDDQGLIKIENYTGVNITDFTGLKVMIQSKSDYLASTASPYMFLNAYQFTCSQEASLKLSRVEEIQMEYNSFSPLNGPKQHDKDVNEVTFDMSSKFFNAEGSEKNCSMDIFEPVLT